MTLPAATSSSSMALVPATKRGASPLDAAKHMQSSRVWGFLGHKLAELKHVARAKSRKKLVDAVTRGAISDVETLLAVGADANASSSTGETALHIAAARGHVKIVSLLLANGADANCTTQNGATPLYLACEKNREHVVKMLLEARARVDVAVRDARGFHPIHVAAKNGFKEVVCMLLQHGARVDTATQSKQLTSLMLAARVGASDVVELLLDKGADPDLEDREGNTPLHFACSEGHYRPTYLLLTAGADPEMPNVHEETPFDVAARGGFAHVTHLLETNGMGVGPELDHAFANDPQLSASIARNRPEIAEIIVKNRLKYARFCQLGCVYEEEPFVETIVFDDGKEDDDCVDDEDTDVDSDDSGVAF